MGDSDRAVDETSCATESPDLLSRQLQFGRRQRRTSRLEELSTLRQQQPSPRLPMLLRTGSEDVLSTLDEEIVSELVFQSPQGSRRASILSRLPSF